LKYKGLYIKKWRITNRGRYITQTVGILLLLEDIRVTGISDGQGSDSVVFTACSSKIVVVTGIVVHGALAKHGVVLNLGLAKRRGVAGDDDHLCLGLSERLHGGSETKTGLTRLHDELKTRVDRLNSLLGGFSLGCHVYLSIIILTKYDSLNYDETN